MINAPNRNELADQYRTQKAERDALNDAHTVEMDSLKKNYVTEKAGLEDRFETSIQEDRLAHYDHLRNVKQQMNKEEQALENTRREVVGGKQAELTKEQAKVEAEGKSQLVNTQRKFAAAEEYERNQALAAEEVVRTSHQKNAEHIISDSNSKIGKLQEEKSQALEKHKEAHLEALNEMATHYDGLRTEVQKNYTSELKTVKTHAAEDLNQKMLTNAVWLQNYSDRANDPFYKMNRYPSTLVDQGEAYKLRVKVPTYDRDQFKVAIAGQDLVLSGVRTNSEKAEVEPGRWISTSSHQNLSERFTLAEAVDARSMSMKEDGDWIEYSIPKFSQRHTLQDQAAQKVADHEDALLIKELDFPKSLPKPTIPHSTGKSEKGTLG